VAAEAGVSFWERFVDWLTTAETWTEPDDGLVALLVEHLQLSLTALVISAVIALPPAIWLAHRRKGRVVATVLANAGRAIPSFGILVLVAVLAIERGVSVRFWPIIVALVVLGIPPIFTNAYTGITAVDRTLVESARGQGYTDPQILRRVELPMSLPLMIDGLRLAAVQIVATTALGAVVGPTGGLGRPIVRGFASLRGGGDVELVGASILVALLTIATDRGTTLATRLTVPEGVQRLGRP
jgi:osmoprotectant transport system permease protein